MPGVGVVLRPRMRLSRPRSCKPPCPRKNSENRDYSTGATDELFSVKYLRQRENQYGQSWTRSCAGVHGGSHPVLQHAREGERNTPPRHHFAAVIPDIPLAVLC